uniref:Uncharacterized protein n=1 Tax=Arundo donax TaxID=35708 RepID=A0A0A9HPL9_ARUDO
MAFHLNIFNQLQSIMQPGWILLELVHRTTPCRWEQPILYLVPSL